MNPYFTLVTQMNTILRNSPEEVRGSRVSDEEIDKGRKIRNRIIEACGDTNINELLIRVAKNWINKNHPQEVLKWNDEWSCYSMQKWEEPLHITTETASS